MPERFLVAAGGRSYMLVEWLAISSTSCAVSVASMTLMELADAEVAMEHARTAFRVVAATRLRKPTRFKDCVIEVLNEDRRRRCTVMFAEAHQDDAYKRDNVDGEQPGLIADQDEVKSG